MSSREALSYAFIESHPADAARVLERLAPASAAALLLSAPLRLSSPVLRQMLPLAGAHCLEQLDDTVVAGLLQGMGAQAAVAQLRYFDTERRKRLLVQLPTALTIAYEVLLSYSDDSVGAWMDPRVLALPADMTVGESLERVRSSADTLVDDPYVIDRDQCLLGYVGLADLLRAGNSTTLVRLVRPSVHRLPAQSQLGGVREHQGWRDTSTLPVVEKGERLVGMLTHSAMQRALTTGSNTQIQNSMEGTLVGIASAYWFGVSSLVQALIGLLPVDSSKGDI